MLPQRQLRAPCVGVLPPGNGVRGFHQRSGGAGVTLLNASPASSPLLSLLCSTWVNAPCPSCAAQLSPPPGRRPRGSCSAFVALPSSLSPMSLGSWPWLGSSLSLVPCCPLRAEPASVPVLCAGDEGCSLSVGEQSRPRSFLPVDAGPAMLLFERGTRRPAFWSCGVSSPACLCCFWKRELYCAETQFA